MPLPAGCVRIDSALGEVPPDIFGGVLVVDRLSALARGGRRVRAARGHQAAVGTYLPCQLHNPSQRASTFRSLSLPCNI